MSDLIHVAAAAIIADGKVLIAKRPDHLHQGGLWEFPGGKLEQGETVTQALVRELKEELGITIKPERPLIRVAHDYGDKKVLLDVWRVSWFEGEPRGCEGQALAWVSVAELKQKQFPAANQAVITALNLPEYYLITPAPDFEHWNEFTITFENALKSGVRLVQFRAKDLTIEQYFTCAQQLENICAAYKAQLVLNTRIDGFQKYANEVGAMALHLSSEQLFACQQRPVSKDTLLGASCHNPQEIQQAQRIGVDFITLSPLKQTTTHPEAKALTMDKFKSLLAASNKPVYALGGLVKEDLDGLLRVGAQGIAAIRGLWY